MKRKKKTGYLPEEFVTGKKSYCTDVEIIETLMRTKGHIARAARILGYQPQTLRSKISRTPLLKEAKNEIREQSLDNAEDKLSEHIYEKDSLPALLEYLKAVGKDRGYGSKSIDMYLDAKVEHTGEDAMMESLLTKFQAKLDAEANDE